MSVHYDKLKEEFEKIKQTGWIKTHRKGDTGIGKTFEDLLEKVEDNNALPDFGDIEIKTKRQATSSMITLFTKSPDYPPKANTMLREQYGYPSPKYENMNILHTTVQAKEFNTHANGLGYKIEIDDANKRLILYIKDLQTKQLLLNNVYWAFDKIESALNKKLKFIAIVSADEKKENNKNYFWFKEIILITGLTLEKFLTAIRNGHVMVDIRIGVYNSGKNKGKTHDHGTGFRITLTNLLKYAEII